MKRFIRSELRNICATALVVFGIAARLDADPPTSPESGVGPAPVSEPSKGNTSLSWAAGEVLKLTKAKVSDDTIIAYISHSTSSFALTANDIVYLKEQGVTDRAITAMLNQRTPAPSAPQYVQSTAQNQAGSSVQNAPGTTQAPTVIYSSPQPTVVQTYPTYVYTEPSYVSYPYYYPYYRSYGWYPGISLSFGWGYYGGYHGGGYHGGYHGGYYHGGYYHGGGGGGYHAGGGYHGGGGHGGHR